LQALRAAISHLDGTGPDTALVGTLAAELELESWDRLVPGVYGGSIDRARIAALGPLVCQIARQDDAVALDIVDRAGTALGAQVGAVAGRLGLAAEVELSCMGGVFQTQGLIEPALERAAAAHIGRLYLRPALLPGVLGAVLLAWRQVGWSVGESQLLNLRESRLEGL
jgi:N-acetylglucosamine kinase-like BadF-type ATPase